MEPPAYDEKDEMKAFRLLAETHRLRPGAIGQLRQHLSKRKIVVIVDDIRDGSLDSEIWPAVYQPYNQDPNRYFALIVRTTQAEQAILPAIVAAIRKIDPAIAVPSRGCPRRENTPRSQSRS